MARTGWVIPTARDRGTASGNSSAAAAEPCLGSRAGRRSAALPARFSWSQSPQPLCRWPLCDFSFKTPSSSRLSRRSSSPRPPPSPAIGQRCPTRLGQRPRRVPRRRAIGPTEVRSSRGARPAVMSPPGSVLLTDADIRDDMRTLAARRPTPTTTMRPPRTSEVVATLMPSTITAPFATSSGSSTSHTNRPSPAATRRAPTSQIAMTTAIKPTKTGSSMSLPLHWPGWCRHDRRRIRRAQHAVRPAG